MHCIVVWCLFCPSVWGLFSKSLCLFFGQVLDVITPPYTSDFVQLFLPILENDSIAGTIRTEGEHDPVAEFIGKLSASFDDVWIEWLHYIWIVFAFFLAAHCKSNFIMMNWDRVINYVCGYFETGSLSWEMQLASNEYYKFLYIVFVLVHFLYIDFFLVNMI